MASSTAITGLASGIDTDALVKSLVAIETQKVTAIQKKQAAAQTTLSTVGELQSKVGALATAAQGLDELDEFDVYKNTSSDSDTVAVEGGGEGLEGSFAMRVQQLATSWKVSSDKQSSATAALGYTGTFTISKSASAIENDPTKTTIDIEVGAGDTLKDIVRRINAADGSGVTATLVTLASNDVRLMLTSVDQGTGTFDISDKTGNVVSSLGLLADSSTKTTNSDFSLRLVEGGAAKGATTLGALFTGIGKNNIAAGDAITLTGKDANGNDVTSSFSGADLRTKTVDELATWLGGELGATVSLNDSGELVATSSTGKAVSFTLAMSGTGTLGLGGSTEETSFKNTITEGRKAFYTLNGLAVSSDTNEDEDSLQGAKVILKNVSQADDPDIQVKIVRDDDGIKKKIQTMLDSYNDLMSFIDEKTKSTIEETTDSEGNKIKTYVPGELTGQYAITSLKSSIQKMMTSEVGALSGRTNYTSLASLGITTTAEGKLEIDDKKFKEALSSDFDGVRRLFANSGWTSSANTSVGGWSKYTKSGTWTVDAANDTIGGEAANRSGDVLFGKDGTDMQGLGVTAPASAGVFTATFNRGIAGLMDQYYKQITSTDGMLKNTKSALQDQINSYGEQVTTAQERVSSYRQTLLNQFSAMEQAMLKLKSQSSSFSSMIGSV